MKKIFSLMFVLAWLLVVVPAWAANNGTGSQTNSVRQTTVPPTGNAVQKQNQVRVQNEGELTEIKTNTQEQESLEGKQVSPRSEMAEEKMSEVASKVEELLVARTTKGGIGEEIRQVAQEQKTAQEQMRSEIKKLGERGIWLKSLIGPDFQAIKRMEKLMEQNQLRIEELAQLKNQLSNQGDLVRVQETLQMMIEQDTAIKEMIESENGSSSLFGWLFRLLAS